MGTKVISFINDNWFLIIVVIALIIYVAQNLIQHSKEEKIALVKHLIAVSIDAIVAEAEEKYADYKKSGLFKRAYVIQTIYEKYPVLNRIAEQEEFLDWLDKLIEQSVARLKLTISEIDRK